MKFSFNWIKEYIETNLSAKDLAELLTLHSYEAEVINNAKNNSVLDIDILPNRFSDSASHFGVAREIATLQKALYHKKVDVKNPQVFDLPNTKKNYAEIKERLSCPRYGCAIMKNIKVGPSPKWLVKKLSLCGVGSINNIVDLTNYIMLELGQPIHAFDFEKISGGKIIIRKANKGEKINLLGNKTLILDERDLVIADDKKVLALAGVKGGKDAQISKSTKTILIESAYFDKTRIYVTSKKHHLQTDASRRFSAGVNSDLSYQALTRIIHLINQIIGAEVVDVCDQNFVEKVPKKIKLQLNEINKLIGIDLRVKQVKEFLEAVGCKIKISKKVFLVTPPSFRPDIDIKESLIEEVARLYGYEKIKPVLPYLPLSPVNQQLESIYQDKLKHLLGGAGFFEVYTYSFLSSAILNILGLKDNLVKIKNPISKRFAILRPSLLPGLLKNLKRNIKHNKEIRIFEIGNVFKNSKGIIVENSQLALVMTLSSNPLFELKGVVDLFLKHLGIKNYFIEAYSGNNIGNIFSQNTLAQIKVNNNMIGYIGNISAKILTELDIHQTTAAITLDFDKILMLAQKENRYKPISKYPLVLRDLAILVNHKNTFSEITQIIEASGAKFIQDIDLFDVYEGKNLPKGKKSLALHITYQSRNHTLKDKEVNIEHQKIEKTLIKKLNAIIR